MRELVERQREAFGVPGAAVAVVDAGGVLLAEGFGVSAASGQREATADTSFAIGSATKAFTAAGVAALVDEAVVEWDRPVRDYLPAFVMQDPVATAQLTLRDLLCHRSGLPRHDLVWYGNTTESRADVVARLRHLRPNADLRTRWQYNNLLYIAVGALCEQVTGASWEQHVRHRLLEPLGMSATTFSAHEAGPDTAVPHAERHGVLTSIEPALGTWLAGPAGSIHSTATDLVRWLQVHLDRGVVDGHRVLSEAAVRELQAPQMVLPESTMFAETRDQAYGLGWFVGHYRGHKLVHHGGNVDGFSSLIAFLPERGVGVAVVSNRHETRFPQSVAFSVFDRLLDVDPQPWAERLLGLEGAVAEGAGAARARRPRRDDAPPPRPLEEYVGSYDHPGYGRLRIELVDGALRPRYQDVRLTMQHRHFEVFDVRDELHDVRLPAVFEVAPDGGICGIRLPMEPAVDPVHFVRVEAHEHLDAELLRAVSGRYLMGTIELVIATSPSGGLTAELAGQPPLVLEPVRGWTFAVRGLPGASVTFDPVEGAVREVVVQPLGVFVPAPADDAHLVSSG